MPHLPSIFVEKGEKKTIGRSPQADVVIDEPSLSRLHAAVSMTGDGALAVEDLGSTNGVFINRSRQKTGPLAVGRGSTVDSGARQLRLDDFSIGEG